MSSDTIAAIATPPGHGGIGIVRVSGPAVPAIARAVLGRQPAPRHAELCRFIDATGATLDEGIGLYFPAPASFTGEHVLELQGHGGPVVMDLLLARVLELGARVARPGEFSEQAFLNDRLDLAQAEAIADLIQSGSEQGARAALQSLRGEFSQRVHQLTTQLTELRVYVEAAMDFPDEEIDFLSSDEVQRRLGDIETAYAQLAADAQQGQRLRDGMTVVIAGPPNAGKSSLLNRLAGYEAAIVTEIPGTTRDVLREQILIDGMPLHVIDTAGLRASPDRVEREGIRRAHDEMGRADRILLVVEDAEAAELEPQLRPQLPDNLPVSVIHNKIDLSGREPGAAELEGNWHVFLSATTGSGLDALREHLKSCVGYAPAAGAFSARRRHLDALARSRAHVSTGRQQLEAHRAGELLAEELRQAQDALGEITGEVTSDDLLGHIFSSFCIGK